LQKFDPEVFVEKQIEEIRQAIGNEKAIIAVSGGVDSTTSAVLTHRAIGENLLCVMLDDAFMRESEPEQVANSLSKPPLNLPVKVLDVKERFLNALKGLRDAEEKRKAFRETFYQTLSETAKKEGCRFLVQGTIKADIVETAGGIKTQHNVLAQIGISPVERFGFQVVEPVASLYKEQVRVVARYLGVPPEISERQPFPGPGLAVRVVGEIRVDKLETLKKATRVVEEKLVKQRPRPSQYFAVILDNVEAPERSKMLHIQETAARYLNVPSRNVSAKIFQDKATGMEGKQRRYGEIVAIKVQKEDGSIYHPQLKTLISLQARIITENPSITRVLYSVKERMERQPYVIAIRAIQTDNFLTAKVANVHWEMLDETGKQVLEKCPNVSSVCYDVTPKPPATIEME